MIELPRAALLANEIAEVAELFSFGTNDLTQTTHRGSPATMPAFPPDYVTEESWGLCRHPLQSLDTRGVGTLMKWGIEQGRKTRPKLKVGICGEHGGDLDSVKFCHQIGMDYVSASPYRVPISRLGAAQAVVEEKQSAKKEEKVANLNPNTNCRRVDATLAEFSFGSDSMRTINVRIYVGCRKQSISMDSCYLPKSSTADDGARILSSRPCLPQAGCEWSDLGLITTRSKSVRSSPAQRPAVQLRYNAQRSSACNSSHQDPPARQQPRLLQRPPRSHVLW